MSIESQVDTARRAVVGTGHAAAHLAASAWESASDLATVAPAPKRRRPSLIAWALLALVGVVVGAAVLRRRRFARLEVDRAGALVIDAPPDAFGAAVVATEAASS